MVLIGRPYLDARYEPMKAIEWVLQDASQWLGRHGNVAAGLRKAQQAVARADQAQDDASIIFHTGDRGARDMRDVVNLGLANLERVLMESPIVPTIRANLDKKVISYDEVRQALHGGQRIAGKNCVQCLESDGCEFTKEEEKALAAAVDKLARKFDKACDRHTIALRDEFVAELYVLAEEFFAKARDLYNVLAKDPSLKSKLSSQDASEIKALTKKLEAMREDLWDRRHWRSDQVDWNAMQAGDHTLYGADRVAGDWDALMGEFLYAVKYAMEKTCPSPEPKDEPVWFPC